MSRIVIAVDGLAGSGKTSISRLLAERLGFFHLSSGLAYRGVAYLVLKTGTNADDESAVMKMLEKHTITLDGKQGDHSAYLFVDGTDVTSEVHTPDVSEATSKSARHPAVRKALLSLQRDAFSGKPIVAEGRDMGSVVFPDAQVKLFIEADPKVRIERRLAQLSDATQSPEEREKLKQEMLKEITERDARDSGRSTAPAIAAPDSLLINNSSKTLGQILDDLLQIVRERGVHPIAG